MRKNILERLERIDRLIRIKGTGTPAELAARLKMSERNIYQYLNLMRDLGAPIKFDPYRETYYYSEEGQFVICFQPDNKDHKDDKDDVKPVVKKTA
jgi:predicted DNA-binding transcriptional regulator YafY